MFWVIIGIVVLLCVLLVGVILLQNPKGGISSGVAASQLMGVKRTSDLLERLTWGFMIAIIVLVVSSAFVVPSATEGGSNQINIRKGKQAAPAAPVAPAPQQSTPQQTAPATPADSNAN